MDFVELGGGRRSQIAEGAEFTQRIIISHRKHRKHRNLNLKVIGAKKNMPHGLSVISVISAGNKKNSQFSER